LPRLTAITRQSNDVQLVWTTTGGSTNRVQATAGGPDGSFATNNFADIGSNLIIAGSGAVTTNYTDTGGATNSLSRYYRIRLLP
jgi:hypothetical protein